MHVWNIKKNKSKKNILQSINISSWWWIFRSPFTLCDPTAVWCQRLQIFWLRKTSASSSSGVRREPSDVTAFPPVLKAFWWRAGGWYAQASPCQSSHPGEVYFVALIISYQGIFIVVHTWHVIYTHGSLTFCTLCYLILKVWMCRSIMYVNLPDNFNQINS